MPQTKHWTRAENREVAPHAHIGRDVRCWLHQRQQHDVLMLVLMSRQGGVVRPECRTFVQVGLGDSLPPWSFNTVPDPSTCPEHCAGKTEEALCLVRLSPFAG
jgi:hypothetical protein